MVVLAAPAHAGLVGSPRPVAGGLDVPWEVVLLPDGRTLVVERAGRVRVIEADGSLRPAPAFEDRTVTVRKFLGLTPHPDYARNRLLYLYETYSAGDAHRSRVVRLIDDGTSLFPAAGGA